jgi:carboxyl-terminal processing protease
VPGGPVALGGKIKVGDRVSAVGQGDTGPMTDVVGWRIDDVVDLIRGKKGTKVRLDVIPADVGVDGPHKLVTIVRDKVKLEEQAASKSIIDVGGKHIGVITLPGFYLDFEAARRGDPDARSATSDVARLLGELKAQHVDGVVMDLRENGGGSLVEAVELTGLFIDKGPVVQVRESGGRVQVESDDQRGVAWDGPLAVLVNRSSASARNLRRRDPGLRPRPDRRRADLRQGHRAEPDRPRPLAEQAGPKFGQVKLTIAQFFRVDGDTTQHAAWCRRSSSRSPSTPPSSARAPSTTRCRPRTSPWRRIRTSATSRRWCRPWCTRHDARVKAGQGVLLVGAGRGAVPRRARQEADLAQRGGPRAERRRDEAKRKTRAAERKAMGLDIAAPTDDDGLQANERDVAKQVAAEEAAKKRPDPLLRETAAILADAITLLPATPSWPRRCSRPRAAPPGASKNRVRPLFSFAAEAGQGSSKIRIAGALGRP